jgi:subtilase family serine protease
MSFAFWRPWRRRNSALRRERTSPRGRTILSLERLESRDFLTAFTPMYFLTPSATPAPTGYSPSQIGQAYGFDQIAFNNGSVKGNGAGQTIAIVDAYDDPNITSDLHQFDAAFGLPDPSFSKVNPSGGGSLPAANSVWATEIALDVEWAHAMAPGANILLVEANSGSESALFSAVQYAAAQPGVSVVSMSWSGREFSSEANYDSLFTTPTGHQGVAFVAATGDRGAPASYPAASPNVLAVGGTSLYLNASNYSSEVGWSGSTGGLSAYEAQPTYQHGIVGQSTTQRASPDVSYNADPNTGFSVYNSYGNSSAPWIQVGGTSAGAPQWAALIAIADQGRALNGLGTLDGGSQLLPTLYQLPSSDFHDVTTGASTGTPGYSATAGYDLVTGRGSPYADRVVTALTQQSLARSIAQGGGMQTPSAPAPPPATTIPSPQPSPPNPFVQVAQDALFMVQGWESGNFPLLLMGWQNFQTLLATYPVETMTLEQVLYHDLWTDLF